MFSLLDGLTEISEQKGKVVLSEIYVSPLVGGCWLDEFCQDKPERYEQLSTLELIEVNDANPHLGFRVVFDADSKIAQQLKLNVP